MGLGSSLGKITKKISGSWSHSFQPVFDTIGSALNGLTGVNSQMNKSYAQQMAAMKAQNQYNEYMWNLQNQYNTPTAQLARMAEAGIDINPVSYALGTGNLSNTASAVSSSGGFSGNGSPAGNPISMAMGVASGLQGMRESRARIDVDTQNVQNMKKSIEVMNQNIKNLKEQNFNIMNTGNLLWNQTMTAKIYNEIARHNLKYAQAHNKPVNWTPSLTGAPLDYGADVLSNIFLGGGAYNR